MSNFSNVNNGFISTTSNGYNAPYFNGNLVGVDFSFSIAAGATNVCAVTITLLDGKGASAAILSPSVFNVWLSDSTTGAGLTATAASGAVQQGVSGVVFGTLTSKKALTVQTTAAGIFILSITDTAKTGFYVCVQNPFTGLTHVSRQLVAGDYGA